MGDDEPKTKACEGCGGTGYAAIAGMVNGELLTTAGPCSGCGATGQVPI